MSQLNSLLESANTYKSLQSDSARLANKWSKTGLLEGMDSETDKNNMSMILENQAKQLVTENSQTGGGNATFNAGTGAAGQWAGVALPLVRKVFGQIAAKEFVSVQPMNLPSGLVFYLDFQYGGTNVNSPETNGNLAKQPFVNGSSLYGTRTAPTAANAAGRAAGFGNQAAGGLYGAGRFGYSTQSFVGITVAAGVLGTIGNADFYRDLDGDSTYPSANTGQTIANSYDGQLLVASTSVTKVNYRATTSANAGSTILQTNFDPLALEGFYLAAAAAVGTTGAILPSSLPAFTKLVQGGVLAAPGIVGGQSVSAPQNITGTGTGSTTAATAFDLNVKPSSQVLVTGSTGAGFTLNVQAQAGAATVPLLTVNNPGQGYAVGDVLNFSLATIPNVDDGVNTTALQITLVQNDLDIAGVISFFGLGTISAANLVTGWALDVGNVASSVAAITSTVVCLQTLQPSDNNRGDFEDGNPALGITPALNAAGAYNTPIAIPEINVAMSSEAIVAKTRKLKAVWTPEFAQDLNAYHSLDAEAELTSIMSEYISLEIDQEILGMLIESAGAGDEYWSATNNVAVNAGGVVNNALGFFNSQGQWFQTLGTKVQKLSNIIHQRTLRGGANFMVCSPTVATIIESIPGFSSNSDGDAAKMSYAFGVQKAGSMNGRYQVYKNPYMTDNTILLGYRGGQFLEAGAVFAPYIPLIMTPLVYDPTTFTPRKGLLTRYAKKMLRPEFYGRIFVSNLNSI